MSSHDGSESDLVRYSSSWSVRTTDDEGFDSFRLQGWKQNSLTESSGNNSLLLRPAVATATKSEINTRVFILVDRPKLENQLKSSPQKLRVLLRRFRYLINFILLSVVVRFCKKSIKDKFHDVKSFDSMKCNSR